MWIERPIDRESQQKLYVQIYLIIKENIDKDEWYAGMRIPAEDELCKTYGVSKATVRTAISELVVDGYLKRKQGKGTYVNRPEPAFGIALKTRLTENIFERGGNVSKEVLVKGIQIPPEDVIVYLKTRGDIYHILCKKTTNGEVACIEECFIPLSICPDLDMENICRFPLYDHIQERAVKKIQKVIQTIEITEANESMAGILNVRERSPALLLHRLLVSSDGNTVAYSRIMGSCTKYKIQTEFERIK
jgi:GntR family transcriptional regulator